MLYSLCNGINSSLVGVRLQSVGSQQHEAYNEICVINAFCDHQIFTISFLVVS